jgi:hypothetical protein
MSVSDIAVTALTAVATVKGNQLTITTSDPRSGALPNIALDHVDIYASQTDTFASASVVAQGTLRALHANAGEGQAWFYWGIPYDKLGAAGTRYPAGATGGVACTSLDQVGLAFGLSNGKLVASVAGSELTIAVKTAAGNDPRRNGRRNRLRGLSERHARDRKLSDQANSGGALACHFLRVDARDNELECFPRLDCSVR